MKKCLLLRRTNRGFGKLFCQKLRFYLRSAFRLPSLGGTPSLEEGAPDSGCGNHQNVVFDHTGVTVLVWRVFAAQVAAKGLKGVVQALTVVVDSAAFAAHDKEKLLALVQTQADAAEDQL